MLAQSPEFDAAALDLLASARKAQEQAIINVASASLARDEQIGASATYLALAHDEARALGRFMIRTEPFRDRFTRYANGHLQTPLLLQTPEEDIDGIRVAHGYVFSLSASHARPGRVARALLPSTRQMSEMAISERLYVAGSEDRDYKLLHRTNLSLDGRYYEEDDGWWRHPMPLPKVEDPDATVYQQQLFLLRAARIELGENPAKA